MSPDDRTATLARSLIWRTPKVPIAQADIATESKPLAELSCKFKLTALGGTTPKFDCDLESGEEIRVKYGNGPEIPAEAASTRLLKALGFAADDIVIVEKLRCFGCPKEPFSTMKAVEVTRAEPLYKHLIDYDDYEEFKWVAVERKFRARPIESEGVEGWAFHELSQVDPKKGGAPRAHLDAIRMIAIFLSHWDNKSENQRIVCLDDTWQDKTPCAEPLLMLQDVGATFGPSKVDLPEWEQATMWEDRTTCRVSMRELPYSGATFVDAQITEEGRQFFGAMISQLSDRQLTDLFTGARFAEKRGLFQSPRPVSEWVRVFRAKVKTITDGPACPSA